MLRLSWYRLAYQGVCRPELENRSPASNTSQATNKRAKIQPDKADRQRVSESESESSAGSLDAIPTASKNTWVSRPRKCAGRRFDQIEAVPSELKDTLVTSLFEDASKE